MLKALYNMWLRVTDNCQLHPPTLTKHYQQQVIAKVFGFNDE